MYLLISELLHKLIALPFANVFRVVDFDCDCKRSLRRCRDPLGCGDPCGVCGAPCGVSRNPEQLATKLIWVSPFGVALFNGAGRKARRYLNIGIIGPIIIAHSSGHDITERLMRKMQ